MTPTLTLRQGLHMPVLGLGLWKLEPTQAETLVPEAIRLGYRHLDSACDYGNEEGVGRGIRRALASGQVRRDELWVTSKLWNTYHARQHVRLAVERTLRDLQLEYLDLYLIHFPIAQEFVPFEHRYPPGWFHDPNADHPQMRLTRVPIAETWGAMEDLVRAGLVRSIGVSNFGVSLLRDLLSYAQISPAVLQVELHPYLTQDKLLRYCRDQGVAVTGFSPLGAPSYVPLGMARAEESVLTQPVILELARRHNRTPAQIVLRWGVQRGVSIVPKTATVARLAENRQIFDFTLSPDELVTISSLDRHQRFNDPGVFCEAAFHTFCPIYE